MPRIEIPPEFDRLPTQEEAYDWVMNFENMSQNVNEGNPPTLEESLIYNLFKAYASGRIS